uniref:Uncharacterized protein n=1 Tax=Glossina austeni TaxID=7395 RepID=A0A1A9VXY7_GLOAU
MQVKAKTAAENNYQAITPADMHFRFEGKAHSLSSSLRKYNDEVSMPFNKLVSLDRRGFVGFDTGEVVQHCRHENCSLKCQLSRVCQYHFSAAMCQSPLIISIKGNISSLRMLRNEAQVIAKERYVATENLRLKVKQLVKIEVTMRTATETLQISYLKVNVNCFIHILTSDRSSKNVPCPVSANHSPYYPKNNRNGNNRLPAISSRTSWDNCNLGQWRDADKEIDYWLCLLSRRHITDDSR